MIKVGLSILGMSFPFLAGVGWILAQPAPEDPCGAEARTFQQAERERVAAGEYFGPKMRAALHALDELNACRAGR